MTNVSGNKNAYCIILFTDIMEEKRCFFILMVLVSQSCIKLRWDGN